MHHLILIHKILICVINIISNNKLDAGVRKTYES